MCYVLVRCVSVSYGMSDVMLVSVCNVIVVMSGIVNGCNIESNGFFM